jgi:high-affinity iron transporter
MAGQAAAVLHGADLLPGWGEQIWDTSFILSDDGFPGRSLHALIGYSARPCGIQLAAWGATLLLLIGSSRAIGRPRVGPQTTFRSTNFSPAPIRSGASAARSSDR